jgi:hypothetical protein
MSCKDGSGGEVDFWQEIAHQSPPCCTRDAIMSASTCCRCKGGDVRWRPLVWVLCTAALDASTVACLSRGDFAQQCTYGMVFHALNQPYRGTRRSDMFDGTLSRIRIAAQHRSESGKISGSRWPASLVNHDAEASRSRLSNPDQLICWLQRWPLRLAQFD